MGGAGSPGALKQARPELVVAVTGCVTDGNVDAFLKRATGVDLYVDPRRPEALLEHLAARGLIEAPDWGDLSPEKLGAGSAIAHERVSQAVSRYVPVIYGCNYNCTYCIVPYTRGVQSSRRPEEILDEARWLLAEGAKEVVLLGQTVDAYGGPRPPHLLAAPLRRLHDLPGLERIRFLTSHPNHMSPDLIDAVAELPRVCEHINLPFQAGDDQVLKRMASALQGRRLPGPDRPHQGPRPRRLLSTDVIVGFCGESEAQFERTLDLLRYARFDVVHVARLLPRRATRPSACGRTTSPTRRRSVACTKWSACRPIAGEINRALEGAVLEVLVEGPSEARGGRADTTLGEPPLARPAPPPSRWGGRTRGNKLVFFDAPTTPPGCWWTSSSPAAARGTWKGSC